VGEGVICVNVGVRSVRSRGFLASYLTSDLKVMSVPLILFVGRDHALILVEVGGVSYMYECASECEC
jgi:hypothetical protein